MFNNRFNSTKVDPLVEAVKQAQQDGNDRRLAEAMVNELFGVYSRQAVIRENLADYDFALEEAYKCMKEAEKMADKDYDKDGKIETSKKEVWGSRLRAAKASGKYKGPVDEDSQIDELSHETLRQYSSRAVTDPSRSAGVELATSKIMGMGHAKVPAQSPESGIPMKEGAVDAGSMEGSKSVTKSAPKEDPSLPKSYPGAASSAPTAQRLSNAKAALKEDGVTAPKEWAMKAKTPNKNAVTKAPVPGVSIAEAVSRKHFQQVADLIKSHDSQEKRNELASHHAGIFAKQNPRFNHEKFHAAAGSTAHQQKKMDEAAYSAKSARAGKDIGKPGKMFAKIAAKAGAKYGSEERGKKVAGAILKKIRAKHMKEENLEELSAFGKAFAAAKGKQFSFGGKQYSGARADAKPSVSSGPKNNPGLGGAIKSGQFATRDTTPIATRSPEQKQAKVDASAVRANKSAMPNPTIGTPNLGRSGSTQSAVGPKGEVTPGSSADYAQKNGMTSTPSSKTSIGVGSGTQAVKDINKSPSAVASVNAANKAPSSTMDTVKSGLASAGAAIDKATGGMAGAAYDKARSAVGLKEEVQVGENKYRIF